MRHTYFVELSCTSCGAKLDISNDMERYTCSYCGTEMLVERRGDELAVRGLADMLKEMQDGANKHAAELALVRYTKELRELREKEKARENQTTREIGRLAVCAILAGCVGVFFAVNGSWMIGLGGLAMALLAAKLLWSMADQRNDSDITPRIIELKQLIKKKERIANE